MTAKEQIAEEVAFEQKRPVFLKHRLAEIQARQDMELQKIGELIAIAESFADSLKPETLDYIMFVQLKDVNDNVADKIRKLENPNQHPSFSSCRINGTLGQ